MNDYRGVLMAEQEHADRLSAVKAEYEKEIERLRGLLREAWEYVGCPTELWDRIREALMGNE